ncbi:MAG: 16S rRNA (guanine(527)-N(7))-methyltransferase RsmG [Anaerolineae bacterium]|nr:16S rRNA (guanine(527)-N(7))-methyltransferase RsmG [Anaerolineae bacterium]
MPTLAKQANSLFNLTLTPTQSAAFDTYAALLAEWNTRMNLTAITDAEGIQTRHFLDSLSVTAAMPRTENLRLIDVGTGAGFPGLPLKIMFPDIQLTLLEATGKKLAFLREVCTQLNLSGVEFLHARAEEAGQLRDQRASYDVAVARAVARLPALLEYLLPLVKVGGYAIAMKGRTAHTEIEVAHRAMELLGGKLSTIVEVCLPDVDELHHLIVVEKIAHTPNLYPRKPGMPSSAPL